MKYLAFLAFLLAIPIAVTVVRANDPSVPQDGVMDLTPDTFDDIVGKDAAVLVEFYAPWCGHCKNLVPEYAKVGKAVVASGSKSVVVAKVNAEAHGALGSRFGVTGFPTIKFFPAGSLEAEEYNGGRDAAGFVSFLNKQTGATLVIKKDPVFAVALTPESFDETVGKDAAVLVEFYAPWCGHCKNLAPIYEKVAKAHINDKKKIVIATVNADEGKNRVLSEKFGVTGFPTIKFFPAGSVEAEDYDGDRDGEGFVSFINKKVDTERTIEGELMLSAGTTDDLNELAKKYMTESKTEAVIAEMKSAAKTPVDSHYVKFAEKIMTGGEEYIEKELARIEKILSGKVSLQRRDDIMIRRNILQKFNYRG